MNRRTRDAEVDDLLKRAMPVIHSAFQGYYRLSEKEAGEAEGELSMWFHRYARRSGIAQAPVRSLTLSLFLAACQYGRSLQIWKHEGQEADENLARALAREPGDLASELAERLERSN
jgi:hypothetical protein